MKAKEKIFALVVLFVMSVVFSSCYVPSPLYGTWGDNQGNKITFQSTGEFTASIKNTAGVETSYKGTWDCIDNVLVITKESGAVFLSEWDIRGAMLYLTWVDSYNTNQKLTLSHISK